MNANLQYMISSTMHSLEERNALKDNCTSAEIRYAADYIVKKSLFKPYFEAIGITKGCQIGRRFYEQKPHEFFSFVLCLYYSKWWFDKDVKELNDLEFLFKKGEWENVSYIAKHYCSLVLRTIRNFELGTRGIGQKEEFEYSLSLNKLEHLFEVYNAGKDLFLDEIRNIGEDYKHIAAIAIAAKNMDEDELCKSWLEENIDEIVNNLIHHGKSRSLLTHLHGFTLSHKENIYSTPTINSNGGFCEYSHATINKMAIEANGYYSELIDRITHSKLLPNDEYKLKITKKVYDTTKTLSKEEFSELEEANNNKLKDIYKMTNDVFSAGSLDSSSLPKEIVNLARKLAAIHGTVHVASESSGIQIYIADPELLVVDGMKELSSRHLAVNAERYLGIGPYDIDLYPTEENKMLYMKYRMHGYEVPSAMSMKTRKMYNVHDLLTMLPVDKRNLSFTRAIKSKVIISSPDKNLVKDENGMMVPEWCGETVPLTSLSDNHPAIQYLKYERGYDINELENLWDICYCKKAIEEDKEKGRFYSKLPLDYKNSPAGRIIIPIYNATHSRIGWQARVIDKKDNKGNKWVWTDRETWIQVEKDGNKLFVSDEFPKGFSPHKYLNGKGSSRNSLLFGLNRALEFNKHREFKDTFCVIVEGPLDVAKGGIPCLAIHGKSLSDEQASIIKKNFNKVCTVMDADEAGKECIRSIHRKLPGMHITEIVIPEGNKDLGDCSIVEARKLVLEQDPILIKARG